MNVFQWITLPLLGLIFALDLHALLFRRPAFRRDRLLRCIVWLAAGIAIAVPDLTSRLSQMVGIQRGADLVLYLFVLTFVAVSFYFYSRYVRLQRQFTDLVRHIAIQEARKGTTAAPIGERN